MSNTSELNKVCAVIPFYNETKTIREVINRTLPFADLIIAVNDGSTDDSCDKIPQDENVIIVSYSPNRGKGYALKTGLLESIKRGTNITLTLDADLQHIPESIPELILALENNDAVVGSRMNDLSDMPLQRILSNKLTSFLLSLKTKQKLTDTQSGFRAYRTEILKDILPSYNGFEAESEMLVKATKKGYKIKFVPIPTVYGAEQSKMKAFQAIVGFIKVLFS